tara:strand:- start:137 stop:319 length:183 start_codon:yes stop_codon:yes gene_type:complete
MPDQVFRQLHTIFLENGRYARTSEGKIAKLTAFAQSTTFMNSHVDTTNARRPNRDECYHA